MNTKTALTTSKWKKERIRETNRDMETEQRAKGKEKNHEKKRRNHVSNFCSLNAADTSRSISLPPEHLSFEIRKQYPTWAAECVYERDREIREEATKEIAHIKWLNNYGFCFVFCFSFNLCCTTEIPIPRKWTEKTQTKTRKTLIQTPKSHIIRHVVVIIFHDNQMQSNGRNLVSDRKPVDIKFAPSKSSVLQATETGP